MLLTLVLATTVAAQVQVQATAGRDTANRREVGIRMQIGGPGGDSVRRIPVTAAHIATAFRDSAAKALLLNARRARMAQDSALRSYDAKVYQRISVGMALSATARERLMMRDEGVARVQWDRDAGAVVDLLGKRTTVPAADEPTQVDEDVRRRTSLPIPYFPGRETLWIGGSVAQVSVNEDQFVHPLADGAEAYYRYTSGDSVVFTLPDGHRITLQELRIEARAPRWNAIVGSFWFDRASAQLVRAVYRPTIEMDIWEVASDTDRNGNSDGPPWWVKAIVNPMRVTMHAFTTEYGLFESRFWLPTSQSAEGRFQAMMLRVPGTFEERYVYESVNGPVDVATPMRSAPPPPLTLRQYRDSLTRAGVDSALVDSLVRLRTPDTAVVNARARARRDSVNAATRARRDSLQQRGLRGTQVDSAMRAIVRARQDSIRAANEAECRERGHSLSRFRRYAGNVDVLLRVPCDLQSLAESPELPASAYDSGEELFGRAQRDEMIKALDFGLQAGWGPQRVGVQYGFAFTRYNRVEGLSTAIKFRQELGLGYSWEATLRGSQGDRQLNGEVGVQRGNARTSLHLNAYRRLVSASDWDNPLTFSSSLGALLWGHDDGVYYRTAGVELIRASDFRSKVEWRLFAEAHRSARVTTRFSVFGGTHNRRFGPNVDADRGTYVGGSVRVSDAWGVAPRGWRTGLDLRLEGAGGESEYGRAALDLSVTRPIAGPISFGLAGGVGTSVGELPAQRQWFLGSPKTIRGQRVGVDSIHAGNAFWMARAELARDRGARRLSLFGDLGWAGDRESDWGRSSRLISAVGVGSSFLQGMIRTDLARGLWPRKGWRLDLSVEAPF